MSANAFAVSGPTSKIMSLSVTSSTFFTTALAAANEPKKSAKSISEASATTTSVGSGTETFAAIAFAVSIKSCSHNDLPTLKPAAAKNVLAIPPPTIN